MSDLDVRRPDLLGVRRTGTVRWWKDEKGYGRITADDGDLLIALATAADSVTGRALRDSGVDLDRLSTVVRRVRTETNEAGLSGKGGRFASKRNRRLRLATHKARIGFAKRSGD
jgi:hypothetical protein